MKKYTNGFAPLLVGPLPTATKIMDLPERSIVLTSDTMAHLPSGLSFELVTYDIGTKSWSGWVYSGWLDEYVESLPANCVDIPNQTPDKRDAEQYFYWRSVKQVNICGEACAAYIMELNVYEILRVWQIKKPSIFAYILGTGQLRGTTAAQLISLFDAFGWNSRELSAEMTDHIIARPRYTVDCLMRLVNKGHVVASVSINYAGRLKPTGVLHWVVVTKVERERAGYGFVELYNPYPNRIERYSWEEFIGSARVPQGVYVP